MTLEESKEVIPVSYTHLDVYKRQVLLRLPEGCLYRCVAAGENEILQIDPVSMHDISFLSSERVFHEDEIAGLEIKYSKLTMVPGRDRKSTRLNSSHRL